MDITKAPRYRCHKIVQALKIAQVIVVNPDASGTLAIDDDGFDTVEVSQGVLSRYVPLPGDYLVIYEDGYHSISPAKAFEEGYTRLHEGFELDEEAKT